MTRKIMTEAEALGCADSLPACTRWVEANCTIRQRFRRGDWVVALRVVVNIPSGHHETDRSCRGETRDAAVLFAAQTLRRFLSPFSTKAFNKAAKEG